MSTLSNTQQFCLGNRHMLTLTQRVECLTAFFPVEDLEWRVMSTTKDKSAGKAAAYVTNRAIQNRLDLMLGQLGWQNEFRSIAAPAVPDEIPGLVAQIGIKSGDDLWKLNQFTSGSNGGTEAGIGVFDSASGQWVWKWDAANNTDIEAVKGGRSNAMKRAGYQWGIGRYLYELPDFGWINLNQWRQLESIPAVPEEFKPAHVGILKDIGATADEAYGDDAQEKLEEICYQMTSRRTSVPFALSITQARTLLAGIEATRDRA